MAESFVSQQRFFDNKNYPRGFSRMVILLSKRPRS